MNVICELNGWLEHSICVYVQSLNELISAKKGRKKQEFLKCDDSGLCKNASFMYVR